MAARTEATRQVTAFTWDAVEPQLIRRLLDAAYRGAGDVDARDEVKRLSPKALRATAATALGTPPRPALMVQPEIIDVLRGSWLRQATAEVVADAFYSVCPAGHPASNKAERLRLLQEHRRTQKLGRALRSSFVRAHKRSRPATSTSRADSVSAGRIALRGQGEPETSPLYPHQVAAQDQLDRRWQRGVLGGCLVLPTGAGKTRTVAGWLVARLAEDPNLRVLWFAHQQELVNQALGAFVAEARHQPTTFERTARAIHSSGSTVSTLADTELDIALVTYQSFRHLDRGKRAKLRRFLTRPTIVVVDEAHHAGAPTYAALLQEIEESDQIRGLIGLTATPYPASPSARLSFRDRFPDRIHEVHLIDLIRGGILAQPVVTTVDTTTSITLTVAALRKAQTADLPPEVLAELDVESRNRLIVEVWKTDQTTWGKTLLFATSIAHADRLVELLTRSGAAARALHSGSADRFGTLAWFRSQPARAPVVLVSVGMLTEGVDVPDARTALLARPTTSPILARQMTGRVLRGPGAGGEATAHLVHFRDDWRNLPDILTPGEVLPAGAVDDNTRAPEPQGEASPGPVVTDEALLERATLAAQLKRSLEHLEASFDRSDDDPFNDSLDPLVRAARIVGTYEVDGMRLPVLDHQAEPFELLLSDSLAYDLKGTPFLSYFDDGPPPYPPLRMVHALVDEARALGEVPVLSPFAVTAGPDVVARQLLDAGPIPEDRRLAVIDEAWTDPLVRAQYPSLARFDQAVAQAVRRLRTRPGGGGVESPVPTAPAANRLPALRRQPTRSLEGPLDDAVAGARRLLPRSVSTGLDHLPEVAWTARVNVSTFAHWSLRLTRRNQGRAVIRVNRLLQAPRSQVSDGLLAYLLYHELLHHLLPGQGHDAEFLEYEARWPGATDHDLWMDTLDEHYDTRPERYA